LLIFSRVHGSGMHVVMRNSLLDLVKNESSQNNQSVEYHRTYDYQMNLYNKTP